MISDIKMNLEDELDIDFDVLAKQEETELILQLDELGIILT